MLCCVVTRSRHSAHWKRQRLRQLQAAAQSSEGHELRRTAPIGFLDTAQRRTALAAAAEEWLAPLWATSRLPAEVEASSTQSAGLSVNLRRELADGLLAGVECLGRYAQQYLMPAMRATLALEVAGDAEGTSPRLDYRLEYLCDAMPYRAEWALSV